MLRQRLFEIIEIAKENDKLSRWYDRFMMGVIIISILPLFFKNNYTILTIIDQATTIIFIIDYTIRWTTADLRDNKHGIFPFLKYPFTVWAIVDILAILPSVTILNDSFRLFKLFRLWKALKALRILRYSRSFSVIINVIHREKKSLLTVCNLTIGYIILSALIMFSAEPDNFESFFDAIYWAVITLTTVGYGDIYPIGTTGRIVCMISSFMGIAIVALPTGIITAGYMNALAEGKTSNNNDNNNDNSNDGNNDDGNNDNS